MQHEPHIVCAAGGTGGHIFPALAVVDALRKKNPDIKVTFIGSGGPIERKLLESRKSVDYLPINSSAIRGKGIKGILNFLFVAPKSIKKCKNFYLENKISCVIGFGGYPSVLPVIAAKLCGLPIIIQEQNAVVGFANKLTSLLARHVFCVPGAKGFIKVKSKTEVMNPVREVFENLAAPKLNNQLKILIMGGSQGAVSLNDAIISLIPFFVKNKINIIHQAGDRDFERVSRAYHTNDFDADVRPFIENLSNILTDVDLVICRAGAMSIAEVSAAGRAAIYVPLPIAGGHQADNARELVKNGAALMFMQDQSLAQNLTTELERLIKVPAEITKMGQIAKDNYNMLGMSSSMVIAEKILEYCREYHTS